MQENIKKKKNKLVILFIIIDSFLVIALVIFYGPFAFFRDLWISTAMTTASHKYLAKTIYSESAINDSINNNINLKALDDTDASLIEIGDLEEMENYDSEYDEQILKRENKDDSFKVIEISGTSWKGHIVAIYDPTKVKLVQSPKYKTGGQILDKLAETYNARVAINASGFSRNGKALSPVGSVIMEGQVVKDAKNPASEASIIGLNKDGVLVLSTKSVQELVEKDEIVSAMEFWPFLVVNGVKTEFSGNGGWGIAPRTAIGQRKDGIILFVVIDGRRASHSLGVSMKELADVMYNYGCYNAANLDGGGSSSMYVDGNIISIAGGAGYSGDRYLLNAWVLVE